jgi:hypothetical protein
VRSIDNTKRTALSRLLMDSVLSTEPGENLNEKLLSLALPTNFIDRKHEPVFKNDTSDLWFTQFHHLVRRKRLGGTLQVGAQLLEVFHDAQEPPRRSP